MIKEIKDLTLEDTKILMCDKDYKKRFIAEYCQTKIRFKKLVNMLSKWDKGKIDFTPTCPRNMLGNQAYYMKLYLNTLEARAELERINLKGEIEVEENE